MRTIKLAKGILSSVQRVLSVALLFQAISAGVFEVSSHPYQRLSSCCTTLAFTVPSSDSRLSPKTERTIKLPKTNLSTDRRSAFSGEKKKSNSKWKINNSKLAGRKRLEEPETTTETELSTNNEKDENGRPFAPPLLDSLRDDQTYNFFVKTRSSSETGEIENELTEQTEETTSLFSYLPILTLLWFVAVLSALDRVAMSVAILPISTEYHLTETLKGQISSIFSIGYGLAIVPCGLLVSAASPRIIMGCGIAMWSLSTIGTPIAASFLTVLEIAKSTPNSDALVYSYVTQNMAPLLAARGVMGAAESVVLPTLQRILSNWIPANQKSFAVACVFSGFQAGTVCAYLVSPWVMENLGGWRGMFNVYGIAGLALLGPWLYFARDDPPSLGSNVAEERDKEMPIDVEGLQVDNRLGINVGASFLEFENVKGIGGNESAVLGTNKIENNEGFSSPLNTAITAFKEAPWSQLSKSKTTWAMVIAHAANNWGLYNSLAWTPTFYAEQYGLNVRDSAFFSVLPSIAGAVVGLLAGSIADRIIQSYATEGGSEERHIQMRTRVRKFFQGMALLGPAACLLTLASSIPEEPLAAQALLTGTVGFQALNSAGYGAAAQEKAGERWAGLLYSLTSLPGVVFGSVGVYVTGQILDVSGQDWSGVFSINAFVDIIGASAFILLYNSRREYD